MNRREFFKGLAGSCAGLCGALTFIDTYTLELTHKKVQLKSAGAKKVRVLHLSDLHRSNNVPLKFLNEAIDLGIQQKPDIVFITGDFVTDYLPADNGYSELLTWLASTIPTYACLGNHDGGKWCTRAGYKSSETVRLFLEAAGIKCLHNKSCRLMINGAAVSLVGVGDLWAYELDGKQAFQEISNSNGEAVLLLCHNPDGKDKLFQYPWQVMFSGHTHGGQLIIPIIGEAPLAPVNDHTFVAGLVPWGQRWIHVSRGVGNIAGIRINCRPEVAILDLYL